MRLPSSLGSLTWPRVITGTPSPALPPSRPTLALDIFSDLAMTPQFRHPKIATFTTLLIAALSLSSVALAQTGWRSIDIQPFAADVAAILSLPNDVVVIAGYGLSAASTDGGVTWSRGTMDFTDWRVYFVTIARAPSGEFYAAVRLSRGSGPFVEEEPALLRCSGLGLIWSRVPVDIPDVRVSHFAEVTITESGDILLGGFDKSVDGFIAKSTDRGAMWQRMNTEEGCSEVSAIVFRDSRFGLALSSGSGRLYRTTDGGDLWGDLTTDEFILNPVADLDWVSDRTWVVGCRKDRVLRSTDDGATWTTITGKTGEMVDFDGTNGYLVPQRLGRDGLGVELSTDGGATWIHQELPGSGNYPTAVAVRGTTAYIGCAGGKLYRTDDLGGVAGVDDLDAAVPGGLRILYGIEGGHVQLLLPSSTTAGTLDIFDHLGRRRSTQPIEAGSSRVEIAIDGFAPGVYLCRVDGRIVPIVVRQ